MASTKMAWSAPSGPCGISTSSRRASTRCGVCGRPGLPAETERAVERLLQSCIYTGSVRHRRHEPVDNRFNYRLFMMYLDLAELPTVFEPYWLWSAKRAAPAWFRRADYLQSRRGDELPYGETAPSLDES